MTGNPYVGPRSIAPGEPIWGREREISELADLVIANRIALVYSPSGAGKTSLLQAGLVGRLAERRFRARPILRVGAPVPEGVTLELPANRYTLSVLLSLEEENPQKTPIAELARMTLADYFARVTPEPVRELLIFDQFEEALTADPLDVEGRQAFFNQLGDVLSERGRWAVFAMREDILGPLDPYVKYLPTRLSHTYRLDLLKKDAALEAVIGPAGTRGVTFTREAAWKLVENLSAVVVDNEDSLKDDAQRSGSGEYVEPVQLQVVCRRVWDTLAEGTTAIGVEQIGNLQNVDVALGEYYAKTVQDVAKESAVAERLIRAWIGRSLITDREPPTRRQISRADEATKDVIGALHPLRDHYLIRSDKRLGQVWYELAHDRLIRPVLKNNDEQTPELERKAALWARQGHNEGLLLGDKDLKRLAAESRSATKLATEFFDRSRQRQRARTVLRVLKGVAVAAALAVAGLAFTIYQDRGRLVQRQKELTSITMAKAADSRRDAQVDLAALLSVEAWNQSHSSDALATLYDVAHTHSELQTILHNDSPALDMAFTPDGSLVVLLADGSVRIWNIGQRTSIQISQQKSKAQSLAVSSDGLFATGHADGRVMLWDSKTATQLDVGEDAHGGAVGALAFDAGGKLLVSGDDKALRFWAVRDRKLAAADGLPRALAVAYKVMHVAVSLATNELVASLQDDRTIRWNLDRPVGAGQELRRDETSVDFTKSGRKFGVAFETGALLWARGSIDTPQRIGKPGKNDFIVAAAISDDDNEVAVAGKGGEIRFFNPNRLPNEVRRFSGHDDAVMLLRYSSPSVHRLASATYTNRDVWIWDLAASPTETYSRDVTPGEPAVAVSDTAGRLLFSSRDPKTELTTVTYVAPDGRSRSIHQQRSRYDPYPSLALQEGGRLAIVAEREGRISIRGPEFQQELGSIAALPRASARVVNRDLPPLPQQVSDLALNRDGSLLAVTGIWTEKPRTVRLFSLADPAHPVLHAETDLAPNLDPRKEQLNAAAFSPIASLLAIGGLRIDDTAAAEDRVMNLWDLADPAKPRVAAKLSLSVYDAYSLAFSPDGKTLAAMTSGGLKLWDIPPTLPPGGERILYPRATIALHGEFPGRVRFRQDGTLLAFGAHAEAFFANQITFVDVVKGAPLGHPVDFGSPVDVLAFQPDGKGLLLWRSNQIERASIDPDLWAVELCLRANRNLTQQEWTTFVGPDVKYENTCPPRALLK